MRVSAQLIIALAVSVASLAAACGSGDDNGIFVPPEAGRDGASEGGGASAESGSDAGSGGSEASTEAGAESGPEVGTESGSTDAGVAG